MKPREFFEIMNKHIADMADHLNSKVDRATTNLLEKMISEKIPNEFYELYANYNGEKKNSSLGIMAGFRWLSLEAVLEAWKGLTESAYEIISAEEELIQDGGYRNGWIPFATDDAGSFLVIDIDPGERGTRGQIITIDRESEFSYVLSKSLDDFLEVLAEDNYIKERAVQNQNRVHLFDDLTKFTDKQKVIELIEVKGFWKLFFEKEIENGLISAGFLSKQKSLFIRRGQVKLYGDIDFAFLKNMVNLKELIIHEDEISSFETLEELVFLRKIVIVSRQFKQEDLKAVSKIHSLVELSLVSVDIKDIGILNTMKSLKRLRLCKVGNEKRKLDGIEKLTQLRELSLEECCIESINQVATLGQLRKLALEKIEVRELDFLENAINLTELVMDKRVDSETNINILSKLDKLKTLIYPLGNMEIVEKCLNLNSIGIDAKRVENLGKLKGLPIKDVTIFNAESEVEAKSIVEAVKKYCDLCAYGWRKNW